MTLLQGQSTTAPATVTVELFLTMPLKTCSLGRREGSEDTEVRRPAISVTLPAYEGYVGAALRSGDNFDVAVSERRQSVSPALVPNTARR